MFFPCAGAKILNGYSNYRRSFPTVLYNEEDKWTAPINIADLIEDRPDLGEYKLHFKYFKITLVDDVDELDMWLNRALDAKSFNDLWEKESMQNENEAN